MDGILPPILHQTFSHQQPARKVEAAQLDSRVDAGPEHFGKVKGNSTPRENPNLSPPVSTSTPPGSMINRPAGRPLDPPIRSQVRDPPTANPIRAIPAPQHGALRNLGEAGSAVCRPSVAVSHQETRRPAHLDDCFDQTPWTLQTNPARSLLQGHPLDHSFSRVDASQRSATPKTQSDNCPQSRPSPAPSSPTP